MKTTLKIILLFGAIAYPSGVCFGQFSQNGFNMKGQSSAPANPPSTYWKIYIDNTGAGKLLKADGTIQTLSVVGHTHTAADTTSGVFSPERLGTGTPDNTVFLRGDGAWAEITGGSGTVTSVALVLPAIFTVSGSPVTTTGTLTGALATQVANTGFFGPTTGADAAPTFRAMVAADLPTGIDAAKLADGSVSSTELQYINSLSSNAQTQLNGKVATTVTVAGHALSSNVSIAAADLTDGTQGSGAVVLATSPTLTTPVLGVASATSINKVAITAPATSATLTIADGKTATVSNTVTLTATDGSTLAIGGGGTLGSAAYTASGAYATASHTHAASDLASGTVGLAAGGTNADLSATGGAGQYLKQSSGGANITVGTIAAGDLPGSIDAAKIGGGAVSSTEYDYLDGVTSAIQTQITGKAASSHTHAADDIASGTIATARLGSGSPDNTMFLRGDQTWATPTVTGAVTLQASTPGTADVGSLNIDNTAIAAKIATGGATAFSTVEKFRCITPTTADTSANATFSTSATTSKALVLQGIASQSADIYQVQTSGGVLVSGATNKGVLFSGAASGVGTSNTAFGVGAGGATGGAASSAYNCHFGAGAGAGLTSGQGNIAIGRNAQQILSSAQYITSIGYQAGSALTTTASHSVGIGYQALQGDAWAGSAVVCLGSNAGEELTSNSLANLFISGSDSYPIANVYFSKGYSSGTPSQSTIIQTSRATGTNISNTGDMVIAGGMGTGTGTGSNVKIQVSPAGSTGSSNNALADALTIDSTKLATFAGNIITSGTVNKVTITQPATSATLTVANGKTLTASNTVTLTATDGSTLAIGTGGTLGTAAYKASAVTTTLTGSAALNFPSTNAAATSDLTITVTGAADGDPVALGVPAGSVTADAQFTAWVSGADTVTVRFKNNNGSAQNPALGTFKAVVFQF